MFGSKIFRVAVIVVLHAKSVPVEVDSVPSRGTAMDDLFFFLRKIVFIFVTRIERIVVCVVVNFSELADVALRAKSLPVKVDSVPSGTMAHLKKSSVGNCLHLGGSIDHRSVVYLP